MTQRQERLKEGQTYIRAPSKRAPAVHAGGTIGGKAIGKQAPRQINNSSQRLGKRGR